MYDKDLEEYTDSELNAELNRRSLLRKQGLCSYCKQPLAQRDEDETLRCRIHELFTGIVGSFYEAKQYPSEWSPNNDSFTKRLNSLV